MPDTPTGSPEAKIRKPVLCPENQSARRGRSSNSGLEKDDALRVNPRQENLYIPYGLAVLVHGRGGRHLVTAIKRCIQHGRDHQYQGGDNHDRFSPAAHDHAFLDARAEKHIRLEANKSGWISGVEAPSGLEPEPLV